MTERAIEFPVAWCASLACILEATIPKPGNVHRGADFESCRFEDFLISAHAFGATVATSGDRSLGELILKSVQATRAVAASNTNLGLILLIAPMVKAVLANPSAALDQNAVASTLANLTAADARDVFAAIRLASPGGLGKVDQYDVAADPPGDLRVAMQAAAERDLIARQYVTDFAIVFDNVAPAIAQQTARGWSLADAVIHTHVWLMSQYADSLIARKCGQTTAQSAATRAARVLKFTPPDDPLYLSALGDLDFWLRSDGNQRNPGTTADLIGAGLFVNLYNRQIPFPFDSLARSTADS